MDRKLDDFINGAPKRKDVPRARPKKKLKATNLDDFLPEEHINFFRNLRIGSKKIARKRVEEL
ncbi:PCNA-inhibitor [Pyrococcus yayanosii]|uniref:Uncharacterized protein n=1 Tax=Pyrococcus yayanosii (strain CH1 / JCM 16557) TaxID=529709 RepID=F8AF49_PYRYC|nr:PCNA-inhibitor [Pyrococcus yayanosii]AEH23723.1 hypothetical protein PYCH_00100 [Pyrococcus yayanosii CH1]